MKNLPAISCVVPTFNGVILLKKHIQSVFEGLRSGDQVIIADDASSDETATWLKNTFSLERVQETTPTPNDVLLFAGKYAKQGKNIDVLLMINQSNQRFGQTVNSAVVFCQQPFFFLLNNDVSVEKHTIDILKAAIEKDHHIFAIGCLEYEQSKVGEKSGKNKLWFERGIFQHSKANNFDSGTTAWASGGSAIFSTEKWRQLGGFDASFYPAYWEDIDISYRARKKGWKVLFNNEAVVYHQHESTNTSVFGTAHLEQMSWKNAFTFAWKHTTFFQRLQTILWYPYWHMQRRRHSTKIAT